MNLIDETRIAQMGETEFAKMVEALTGHPAPEAERVWRAWLGFTQRMLRSKLSLSGHNVALVMRMQWDMNVTEGHMTTGFIADRLDVTEVEADKGLDQLVRAKIIQRDPTHINGQWLSIAVDDQHD